MDKFWVVAKREYLERVRSRWFIMMTLFIPLFISAAFLVPVWVTARSAAGASVRNIIVLDATGIGLGQRVADVLMRDTVATPNAAALPRPQVRDVTPAQLAAAEDSATREVMRPNSVVGYLVLDDSTVSARQLRYAGRNGSSIVDMEKLKTAVRQAFTGVVL